MMREDEGLTVVELLVAMLITLTLMAPLVTAFVIGLSTTRASEQDAGNSADAQLLASFFDTDVASAETVNTASGCGGAGSLLELRWTDGAQTRYVAYRAVADSTRQDQLNLSTPVYSLERVVCSGASGPAENTQTVARTLAAVPTVACDNARSCTGTPRRITLNASAYTTQISDVGSSTRFTFGVTATRRVRP